MIESNRAYREYKDNFDISEHWRLRTMILREKYNVAFEIFNQKEIDDSLYGYVTVNDNNRTAHWPGVYEYARSFIDNKNHTETGLNIIEYLSLPDGLREIVSKALADSLKEDGLKKAQMENDLLNGGK